MKELLTWGPNPQWAAPVLDVSLAWSEPSEAGSPFLPVSLLADFATLASFGGFAGSHRAPARAAAEFVHKQVGSRSGRWVLALREAEPGAVLVLMNVLLFSHAAIVPLSQLAIHSSLSGAGQQPARLIGHVPPPFSCSIAPESSEVHLRVEFAAEPSVHQAETIASVLKAWCFLTAAHGFEKAGTEPESPLLFFTDDPSFLLSEAEMVLDDASFDEAAFDALVNALVSIHERVLPIVALEID